MTEQVRSANEDLALLRDITDLGDFNKFATPALVYWINRAVKAEAREAEFADKLERMEQALRKIASQKPKEKPEWGDATDSGNYDDVEANGWDICAWGVAEIAEQALEGGEAAFDPPQLDSRDTTTLIYDEQYDNWECAKCDMVWHFYADGPKENKINYCPECGRKIVALEGGDPK